MRLNSSIERLADKVNLMPLFEHALYIIKHKSIHNSTAVPDCHKKLAQKNVLKLCDIERSGPALTYVSKCQKSAFPPPPGIYVYYT